MSRSRRRRPSAPPPEPPALYQQGPAREPESVSRLGYVEFHRIANRILDALDTKRGTGALYTPDEIERNCRAREVLREELDRIIGQRDSVSFRDIQAANAVVPNVLRFHLPVKGEGLKCQISDRTRQKRS